MNPMAENKPIIIGLYGIPASGKSHVLALLRESETLKGLQCTFDEGSELISKFTNGNIKEFKGLDFKTQTKIRKAAIHEVVEKCREDGKPAIITGHYMFLCNGKDIKEEIVGTETDWDSYTHIIYLDADPTLVASRIEADEKRQRLALTVKEIREWQNKERTELRKICFENGILFTVITGNASSIAKVRFLRLEAMLADFCQHTESKNLKAIESALEIALDSQDQLEKVLVLDADKTLSAEDTGSLFWEVVAQHPDFATDPLKQLFKKHGYSYAAFRQATLLYEELHGELETVCNAVAKKVEMYPEMVTLLARVAKEPHTRAIVVTCGLGCLWEMVLKRNGLQHVRVIGNGTLSNGHVVTGAIKGHVVDKIHEKKLLVAAFGDGPLDMEMLKKSDEAYVIVGAKKSRSNSMENVLEKAIDAGLVARQILFPADVPPRLNLSKLPKFELDDANLGIIFKRSFIHATDKNARLLLQTLTRDANVEGHDLRKAHEHIGYYLAIEFLTEIIGVERYDIPHVQGQPTDGYRYKNEDSTLIVALMRGGEPMAFGVNEGLKKAPFVHAQKYEEIDPIHFKKAKTVILVDSVINSGNSIMQYLQPLREQYPNMNVVIVAGVVQEKAVELHTDEPAPFAKALYKDPQVTLVALRKSENKYVGKGKTDTGDRLFNTTYM